MYRASVIQQVCGGISLPSSGGGWRRRDYLDKGSASPRSRESWASTASRSAAGRRSLNNPECAGCARRDAGGGHQSAAGPNCATLKRAQARTRGLRLCPQGYGLRLGWAISSSIGPGCGIRGPRLAPPAQAQLDLPTAQRAGAGARRADDPEMKEVPLAGVNPIGWTVVRREIGSGCGRVVPRTARAKDNRTPSAVCGCCISRR